MSDTLSIPNGASFEAGPDGLVLRHDGDIEITGSPATSIAGIASAGNVRVGDGVSVSWIEAGGNVVLGASSSAARLEAGGDVQLGDSAAASAIDAGGDLSASGDLSAKTVRAAGSVTAGGLLVAESVEAGSLSASAGAQIDRVHVREDATFAGAVRLGDATADGTLTIGTGEAEVGTARAARLVVDASELTAKGLQGAESVSVGDTRLSVDAIIAPEVNLAPTTQGRAAVIESSADLGPNAIKGGFSLADFADFSGVDAGEYLAARHLVALGDAVIAPPASVPEATADSIEEATAPEPAVVDHDALEELDELEEIEDLVEVDADPPGLDPELHKRLVDVLGRMEGCYEDEQPAAIGELRGLISAGDVDTLRGDIARIWKDLLAYHQQRSMRIPHRVTNTFNTLNSIVRKA